MSLDTNTYAIGDVHGRFDLLSRVLGMIEERSPVARVVFLGDYIDRGPKSREVIETLMAGPRRAGDEWVCLKGNHEAMMLETIRAPLDPEWWCGNGGAATLKSFGGSIPENVLAWCESLPVKYETDHHFFVHAGIRPEVPLGKQREDDLLWVRGPFLDHEGMHPKHIVHGHTPNKTAITKPNRTDLDSAAFWTGRLSCGHFDLTQNSGPKAVLVAEIAA